MDHIETYLTEMESVIRGISRNDVHAVVEKLLAVWRAGRLVFVIGNGGSAATASHMMNDLNKFTATDGLPRFRCVALTDNVPLLTAVGNDLSYAEVFVEPLRSLLSAGDVVIAISASGNSPNIVKAMEFARASGAEVIGFCGSPGGQLAAFADLKVIIPSPRIGQQEDGHLILNHAITSALRERLAAMSQSS